MKYGYARVSSTEQNLDRQILALKEFVSEENIVVDKASGKNTEREGYQALKGRLGLREGDTLYLLIACPEIRKILSRNCNGSKRRK